MWLPLQASAWMEMRLLLFLDCVADVSVLQEPSGQLPRVWPQWQHLCPSRGWTRRGCEVFLEPRVAQLGHEFLFPAAGLLAVRRRGRCGRPCPSVERPGAAAALGRSHHPYQARSRIGLTHRRRRQSPPITFPGAFPPLQPHPSLVTWQRGKTLRCPIIIN